MRYNFAAGSFWTMKLCSRLLMLLVKISGENDSFRYLNPILGKLGMTHDQKTRDTGLPDGKTASLCIPWF